MCYKPFIKQQLKILFLGESHSKKPVWVFLYNRLCVFTTRWLSCAESQATTLTAIDVVNPERAVFTH